MKSIRRFLVAAILLCCISSLTACDSFYQLFIDENDTSSGVYTAIYDKDSSDEDISAIPETPFLKGDLREAIKTYDLSFEVTLSYDLETENEASLSFYYYHNRENASAADFCQIGNSYMGTYTADGDKVVFTFEPDGYNMAFYKIGSDFADVDAFKEFSYAGDGSCGIWAYENALWDYEEEAVILEDVIKAMPQKMELTLSGNKITDWKVLE